MAASLPEVLEKGRAKPNYGGAACATSRLRLQIAGLLGASADVVNRRTLKPLLRNAILRDTVDAF